MKRLICIAAIALIAVKSDAAISGITTQLVVGFNGAPTQAVIGSDGNLWFSDSIDHAIGKETVTQTSFANGGGYYLAPAMPAGKQPGAIPAITPGPDGALWFTWDDSANTIAGAGRLTTSGTMTLFPVAGENYAGLSIVTGPDGNLWFVNSLQRSVVRVTPSGDATRFKTSTTYTGPTNIVAGPDGNLWISEDGFIGSVAAIARVTPSGAITDFALPNSASRVAKMAAGADGAVWFTDKGTNSIGRIGRDGAIAEYAVPSGATPAGIVSAPDHRLWFIEANAFRVGRVTPAAGAPVIEEQAFSGHGTANDLIVFQKPAGASGIGPLDTATFRLIGNFTPAGGGLCFVYFDIVDDILALLQAPDLTISKTHTFTEITDNTGTFTVVTYDLTVTNVGAGPTTAIIEVTDPMPVGLKDLFVNHLGTKIKLEDPETANPMDNEVTCTIDAATHKITCTLNIVLFPKDSRDIMVGGTIDPLDLNNSIVSNQATVKTEGDSNSANDTSNADSFLVGHFLGITKDHVSDSLGFRWRITVVNNGKQPTGTPVTITDTLPAGVTPAPFGDLSDPDVSCSISGQTVTCQINKPLAPKAKKVFYVFAALPPNKQIANTASVRDAQDIAVSGRDVVTTDGSGTAGKAGTTASPDPNTQPTHGRH